MFALHLKHVFSFGDDTADRCPACGRAVVYKKDYMDYTLMSCGTDCLCGWHYYYDTGNTEEGFEGRWIVYSHYTDSTDEWKKKDRTMKRRCFIWRHFWWVLKPLFSRINKAGW